MRDGHLYWTDEPPDSGTAHHPECDCQPLPEEIGSLAPEIVPLDSGTRQVRS